MKKIDLELNDLGTKPEKINFLQEKRAHNFRNLTGQKFGKLTALRPTIHVLYRNTYKKWKWLFKCDCGNIVEKGGYTVSGGSIKSCGCSSWIISGNKHGLWKGYGEIPKTYLLNLKKRAATRKSGKLIFDINLKYIWKLFLKQNRRCALSGEMLQFGAYHRSKRRGYIERTASLDRINSSIGYVKGNVQWIHKRLNTMKMDCNQNEFIEWCKKVSQYTKV